VLYKRKEFDKKKTDTENLVTLPLRYGLNHANRPKTSPRIFKAIGVHDLKGQCHEMVNEMSPWPWNSI
jgi:hypothetical protein